MNNTTIATEAAKWALAKVGCRYSQAKRLEPEIFDCSSLIARAYSAQGKDWFYGGNVPTSNLEVYDDEFELLWPESYTEIGKVFGNRSTINLAKNAGDLQFLCTDSDTKRENKITHVAMVANSTKIVHARGTKYGVCTNTIDLYSGKLCALTRYNPICTLRIEMKGNRTIALQKKLNTFGYSLDVDGEYGRNTEKAVKKYQEQNGLIETGQADISTLKHLGLYAEEISKPEDANGKLVRITGGTVNIRSGPGKDYEIVEVARLGDEYETVEIDDWIPIKVSGKLCWVSKKFVEDIAE